MAIQYLKLPAYYGTLQKEQGLKFSDIQELDRLNRVYIGEFAKADQMVKQGKTLLEILNYFRGQGYNVNQVGQIQTYLNTATTKDPVTQKTPQEKLYSTISQVKAVGLGVAELLTAFGVIKQNSVPQVVIPNYDSSQYSGIPQTLTYGVDTGNNKIVSEGGSNILNPSFTPPNVTASGLPEWINVQNALLLLLFLVGIYFISNQSNNASNNANYGRNERKR